MTPTKLLIGQILLVFAKIVAGNIGALNLGNAIGAALGGAVIAEGWGYSAVALSGAAASGIGFLFITAGSGRGVRRPNEVLCTEAGRS